MKVMLVVTSLMGAGHLQRTLILARALAGVGATPMVVSGGRTIPHLDHTGVRLEQLPPVYSDGIDYSRLMTPQGEASAEWLAVRQARLVELAEDFGPDIVVTELFPFGRRILHAEFLALFAALKPGVHVAASIRDVLEPKKKAKRLAETAERLRAHYDLVLVHGEERLTPLALTWPPASELAAMIRYTGYVAAPPPDPIPSDEILVAVGGGVIGDALVAAAIAAARRSDHPWRIRVGGPDAAARIARFVAEARGAAIIESPAPDYRARLGGAACSVSLFGYNTATDIMFAETPAVIAPMAEGEEYEQRIRADAFRGQSGFTIVDEPTPDALLAAVEVACAGEPPERAAFNLSGADTAASLLAGLIS